MEIPHPPGLPIVGNLFDLGGEVPFLTIIALGEEYGEHSWIDLKLH